MRGQPLRVLLVDDEASLREPLAKYLRRECGYYVDTAANGEETLARIEGAQGQYDVALVDNLLMPGPDLEPEPLGIKLMAEIKARYPHIEFILFTAWGMDSGIEALRAGAYRYIRKPFNVEELAVMIEHAAEYQRLKGVAREKQILEQLMETSTALLGGGGLQDVLDTILRGVQAIGFDRARLYLLSEDGRAMVGRAQVGMEAEFVGLELPVADDVYVQALLADPRPHVFEREDGKPLPYEQQLAKEEVNQWACVPLLRRGEVIGKLSADNKFSQRPIVEAELGLVALFASQAAAAIENARLRDREQEATQKAKQRARNLAAIQEVSTAISSLHELNKILDATCRAAVELFGVNHSGLVLFEPDYEHGRVVAEYPDLGTRDIEIPLRGVPAEERLTTSKEPLVISDVAGEPSLGPVRDILDEFDIRSILIVPVVFKGRVLGSFSLDAIGHSRTFTEDELELCKTFAAQVAVAIENARLFEETRKGLACLRSVSEAGSVLISTLDPDKVLQVIVEQARQAVRAWRASTVLIDEDGQPYELAATGYKEAPDISTIIRPAGISKQVVRTGLTRIIEDVSMCQPEVNPDMIRDAVGAAVCLPLSLRGRNIGVVWIQYREPRSLSETEIEALRIYTEGAAIAYDNAQRVRELEHMRQAAEALAGAAGLRAVLTQIVRSAREVLQADSTAIWSYDAVREQFILEGSIADGIPVEVWKQFRQEEPRRGQTSYTVMEQKWVGVEDVGNEQQYPFLGESTRKLLEQIGARSFQGIALTVGEEKLGVLYVNYNRPCSFSEEERETARTFANHAALALKNAKLLDQVNKARNAARTVAEVTALEDLQSTLGSIVKGTRDVLGCDTVTLYTYDQDRGEFGFPPAMIGVKHPEKVLELGTVVERSVVHNVLALDDLCVVEDTMADSLMRGPFVEREGIASSVGIPLIAKQRKAGVMFVNYRHQHRFTADELTNIKLFANQAAVAIRNAQLYEQVRKRARALQALYEAGRAMTSSLELDEILSRVAEQAWKLMGTRGKEAQFSHLALVDGAILRFAAAYPSDYLPRLESGLGDIDLEQAKQIGITGRVVKTGQAQLVGDITEDTNYITHDPDTLSELAVPIKINDKIIGVINVEHSDYNAFDGEDQQALQSLAAEAAIAIQNARLFEETQRHARLLDAAAQVARGASAILDTDKLLNEAVRLISDCFDFYHTGVFLLDKDRKHAILQAAYPKEGRGMLKRGHRLRVGQDGIVGFVTQTGEYHLAPDVEKDPYHLVNPDLPLARSEMVFPLIARGQVIGALDVQSTKPVNLRGEDIAALQTMADQLANAIHNAQLYQQLAERLEEANALQQVAASLAGASELQEVLNLVMAEAVKLTNTEGGSILLWDSQTEEFTQTLRTDSYGRLQPYRSRVRTKGGLTRMIIEDQRPIVIPDTLQDPRVNPGVIAQGYRSSLGVPLLSQGEAIGVLYLRSKEPRQFSGREISLLEALASQVAVAIDRARRYDELKQTYEELKRTKGLVGARTAVAWMGMVSTAWRHTIEGHAITIREEIQQLRSDLPQQTLAKVYRRLTKVERLTEMILDKPITPPLSEEEGVESVSINELVQERIRQLWENEPYQSVGRQLDLVLNDAATVRASPEWLRRVFDVLVDNAIEAMTGVPDPALTVSTRAAGTNVEVVFADTGQGISENILPKLFHEQIKKPKGAEGLGMGLLMAQTIAQTYGGEIRVESTNSAGTSMAVSLPIETQSVVG